MIVLLYQTMLFTEHPAEEPEPLTPPPSHPNDPDPKPPDQPPGYPGDPEPEPLNPPPENPPDYPGDPNPEPDKIPPDSEPQPPIHEPDPKRPKRIT